MSESEDTELITERRKVYGDPEATFIRIAQVWSGIIGHEIQPVEVPLMMAGMKMVRTQVCPDYSDNSDDIDGYMDIFRLLVGDDMIQARSVDEYLKHKAALLPPTQSYIEGYKTLCVLGGVHLVGRGHEYEDCPVYEHPATVRLCTCNGADTLRCDVHGV